VIFLIEYDRPQGRVVRLVVFDDSEREKAENVRLDLELDLSHRGVTHEIVLLEALSEEALRRTHRRYFEDVRQILASGGGEVNRQ
jgi:hypothetical protein